MTGVRASSAALAVAAIVLAATPAAHALKVAGVYTSHRYHYSLTLPAGWRLTRATSTVAPGLFPDPLDTETDRLTAPGDKVIGIASTPVKKGETLAQWTKQRFDAIELQFSCFQHTTGHHRIGGVVGTELTIPDCRGSWVDLEVLHGGRGYDVFWIAPHIDRTAFYRVIAGFKFTS